ncbi:AlbA family DNA-binding domain-containing protein [Sinomicrobium sp. M5D2P17]
MTIETQNIEYKDFSKAPKLDRKTVISKLFKEITAFSNSKGGRIIVGKDDVTGSINKQPEDIIKWLNNDFLTSEVNRISDNLVVFKCEEDNGIITITIQESDDPISANLDYKGINKGDCYDRKNHEATLIKGEDLRKLIERKAISIDSKLKALRKIVHYKFANGQNSASEMNIFDSLVVAHESKDDFDETVFDSFMIHQFIGNYQLPLSKHSTMQLHIQTLAKILETPAHLNSFIVSKRDAFNALKQDKNFIKAFIDAHREKALASPQLKNYIFEYKEVIEK